jgi:hypothetical protein
LNATLSPSILFHFGNIFGSGLLDKHSAIVNKACLLKMHGNGIFQQSKGPTISIHNEHFAIKQTKVG